MSTATAEPNLRVLHLEDDPFDRQLVQEMLESEGLRVSLQHATTAEEFQAALKKVSFDLIISDFTLPSYDGRAALAAARDAQPEAAFIFFSGTIGEEIAVDSLKTGATDYVLKQRPKRLISAVRRAIEEMQERRRRAAAEAALRRSEERFRIVARATNDAIWDWNPQTNEVWRNESYNALFGPGGEGAGTFDDLVDRLHLDDRRRVLTALSELLAGGGKVWWCEYRLRKRDGTYAHVFDRGRVIYDESGRPARFIGVMIDVTERMQAEEKIREQAALLQKAQDAVIVCDLEDRVVFWNPSAERIYGRTLAEALGHPVAELVSPENKAEFDRVRAEVMRQGEWVGELRQANRAGRAVIVQSSWTLVRNDAGQPTSKLMINTDLTERRQLEEQLIRGQRLESLGVLVGGIAHDLNNSLAPILMATGALSMYPLPEAVAEMIRTIETSARRGSDMVAQVLTFARGGSVQMATVQVDQLVTEMGKFINDTFPKNIQCHVRVQPSPWQVTAAATQIHQVLMNLCLNARDAMEQGGDLIIKTENVTLTPAQAAAQPGVRPGRFLCLSVTDTGSGISPEKLPLIFEPFYTSKPPGKGTGIGLTTSQAIVKKHGGFITVTSEVGKGTEFKVFLPALSAAPVQAAPPSAALALPAGRNEGILVVDDEAAVLAVVRNSLENYGYRVFTAASGAEAVALFTEKQLEIQLVLTDLAMPFMDGAATLAALRRIQPAIKVIAASGFATGTSDQIVNQLRPDAFLEKPFTAEKLLRTAYHVLHSPA